MNSLLEQAGCWFLHSGIQESSGGVARYHRSDLAKNAPVSTEITGYAVSTFAYLYSLDPKPEYRRAMERAALYLAEQAWSASSSTFPFEPESKFAYFFDIGIIVRGLLAAWRVTGDEKFQNRAREGALSLALDFVGDGEFYPILTLPDKQPLAYESRWSRSPGCYQLKSALAWNDIGDEHAARMFAVARGYAIANHEKFLSGESDREKLMDRLHAYCYFLEAMLAAPDAAVLSWGIQKVGALLREIGPQFERSDVCAQLLRVRLIAHYMDLIPLDRGAAAEEAEHAASFQDKSGGFWFGRKGQEILPFMNPVSTGFCLQALAMWQQHQSGAWRFALHELI